MPNKICPDCSSSIHVRVRKCSCGFVFPIKSKKKKEVEPSRDAQYVFNGWKKVPPRTRKAKCGLCAKKLKGGDMAWLSSFDDGEKYWWCEKCYGEA